MAETDKKYYIVKNGAQAGPYSKEDLASMEDFTPQTRVFVIGGGSEFINAKDIPELADALSKPKAAAKPKPEQPHPAVTDSSITDRIRREAEAERRRREAAQQAHNAESFGPQGGGATPPPPAEAPAVTPEVKETAEWFLAVNGQTTGPFTASEALANLSSPSQSVIRKGDTTWHTYADYPELASHPAAAAILPPPPAEAPVYGNTVTPPPAGGQTYGQETSYNYVQEQTYTEPAPQENVFGNPGGAAIPGFLAWLVMAVGCLLTSNLSSIVDKIYYYCGLQEKELTIASGILIIFIGIPAIAGLVQNSKAKSARAEGLPARAAKYSGLAIGYGLSALFASFGVWGLVAAFLVAAGA